MQTIVCFILFGILFGLLIYEFWGYNKKYTATKFIWTKPTSTETINLCEESGYLSVSDYKSELGNLITQYATLYAQAKTYNATPIISKTDKVSSVFYRFIICFDLELMDFLQKFFFSVMLYPYSSFEDVIKNVPLSNSWIKLNTKGM